MTTFAFPSIIPTESTWEMISNTMVFQSELSSAIQTLDRGGERWAVKMLFRNLKGDDKADLKGFLARINGQQHRITLRDHSQVQRGLFGGAPLVAGASQTGTSLNIDGCSNSITNWIRPGDHFSVNGELKMAVIASNSDGAGLATLTFSPRLRSAPADNAVITTVNPTGTFLLAAPKSSWSNRAADFGDFTVQCIEDIAA